MNYLAMFLLVLFSASAVSAQDDKKEPPPVAPQWTLEPMTHWVPHCPKGTEPWYEPAGNGCPSYMERGWLDHKLDTEPVKDSEVECRPVGSQPKVPIPTACAI